MVAAGAGAGAGAAAGVDAACASSFESAELQDAAKDAQRRNAMCWICMDGLAWLALAQS